MIYFIGGPPRVGKSIIAAEVTRRSGISAVSTDSLGAVLETVGDPKRDPGLLAVSQFNEMAEADRIELLLKDPTRRIEYQLEESAAVWRAVEPFVLTEQEEGRDLVTEGVAILPELVNRLVGVDYRVVFVGNQALTQEHNIKRSAKENKHDWMRHASDEYAEAFAGFVVEMSRYIEREARRYGLQYFELQGKPFADAVAVAVDLLLG